MSLAILPQGCDEEGPNAESIPPVVPVEDPCQVIRLPGLHMMQPHRQECVRVSIAVLSERMAISRFQRPDLGE